MKLILLGLIISATLIISCTSNENQKLDTNITNIQKVDIPNPNHISPSIDEVIRMRNIVILKSKPNVSQSLISDIASVKKVLFIKDKFLVLDTKYALANVYDYDGKYLYSLNKLNTNKGGSSFLLDMSYHSPTKSIYLASNTPNKLMKFSLTGELIKEYAMNFFPTSLGILKDNSFLFDVNFNFNDFSGKNNLILTDSIFEIQERYFHYANVKDINPSLTQGGIYGINDTTYYCPAYSKVIFYLNKKVPTAAFYIHFPGETMSLNDQNPSIENNSNYKLFNKFLKKGPYIGFNYLDMSNKKYVTAFYNLDSKKFYRSDLAYSENNKEHSGSGMVFQSEDKLMMLVNISTFYKKLQNDLKSSSLEHDIKLLYENMCAKIVNDKFDDTTLGIVEFDFKL